MLRKKCRCKANIFLNTEDFRGYTSITVKMWTIFQKVLLRKPTAVWISNDFRAMLTPGKGEI